MKRIVHVIIGLGRGGAEKALANLVLMFAEDREFEHVVISLKDMGCYGELLRSKGVSVFCLGLFRPIDALAVFMKLVVLLRNLRPDLIQTWMYHADFIGGLAAKLAGSPPVIWGVHSFDLKRGARLSTRLVQRLCALASSWLPARILCVAEASRRSHVEVGYDSSRILVIPNGFDLSASDVLAEEVTSLRDGLKCGRDGVIVGCVGRFHPAKDHHNFIRAAALLREQYSDVWFMMVGPGLDWSNEVLVQWIDDVGIRDRVLLMGERDDIPQCLKAMDIFCSSSRTEAFPLVVGEAMVMGRPAVVTDVGDTGLLVGDAAVVVPREDAGALAMGLARLISAPKDEREKLGMRAQERVRFHFSAERNRERTIEVYRSLLEVR